MKKQLFLLLPILLLFIAACGGSAAEVEPTAVSSEEESPFTQVESADTETGDGRATPTTPPLPELSSQPEDYPSPPTVTPYPEGYPTVEIFPTANPYPEPEPAEEEEAVDPLEGITFATLESGTDTSWVVVPAGVQCEPESKLFANIGAAIEALNAESVDVYDAEIDARIVCAACGCPESAHYRLQIGSDAVETAVSLGFVEEE